LSQFDDKYYGVDPAEGGKLAAVDLRATVQQYVKSVDARLGSVPIMARAFASGDGLATLLAKAGIANLRLTRCPVPVYTRLLSSR
jgi:hypothetical protein